MSTNNSAKGIFASTAPGYFEAGISVMPLVPKSKKPLFFDWSQWRHKLPTAEEQSTWLSRYSHYNIGLILGEQSQLIAIDIDTDDEKFVAAIESVLPFSPWVRKGQRGYVKLYRYNGQRIKHINDEMGKGIVDVLSGGSQIVLPPSIHPDTLQPYSANCDLLSVLDQLTLAPVDIAEQISAALTLAGAKLKKASGKDFSTVHFVSAGSRDVQMVQYAGHMATAILRGDITVRRALDNMQVWCENFVENVAGDPLDMNKGMNKIIQFLLIDIEKNRGSLKPGWDDGLNEEEKKSWGLDFSEDVKEWTQDQLMEYIDGELRAWPTPNDPNKRKAIEFVLKKIHQSSTLTALEIDTVLGFVSKNSGDKISVATYKKRIKEMSQGEIAGINHTELAEVTVKEFEEKVGEIRYDKEEFWKWGGSHWDTVENREIERMIAQNFGHMDAAKRYNDITGIRKMMVPLVPKDIKKINAQGVNFANGFLTEDLRLLEHTKDFGMTYTMPFRYLENAAEPKQFLALLHSYWGHMPDYEQIVLALREAIGATIFGLGPKLQRAICLYGPGGTGKSQLLDVLGYLTPAETRTAISPDQWGERFIPSDFIGKLVNLCGELKDKKYIEGKNFKEIITGDEIAAERKYGSPFKFRPTATHWFSSNSLPRSRDISNGFNRRWLFLNFDKIIQKDKKVLDIGKHIGRTEIEEIAAWALQVVPALLARGEYTQPSSHVKLQDDMSLQNSPVRQYFKTCVTFHENKVLTEEQIYASYWNFVMLKMRSGTLSQKNFFIQFEQIVREYPEYKLTAAPEEGFMYHNMALKEIKA